MTLDRKRGMDETMEQNKEKGINLNGLPEGTTIGDLVRIARAEVIEFKISYVPERQESAEELVENA